MLVTKKNKAFDEDLPAVIKKKPRCKKSRDKFSFLYIIPIQALSQRSREKVGISVYDSLTCKQCKPNKFFHKRFGLTIHNKFSHGRDSCLQDAQRAQHVLHQRAQHELHQHVQQVHHCGGAEEEPWDREEENFCSSCAW